MPLIGLNKHTGERVDITKLGDPRRTLKRGDLVCPYCNQEMTVVAGLVRIKHFRHLVGCSDTTVRHPESIQHLLGKMYVSELLKDMYPTESVEFEVNLPEIGRIADVLLEMKTGWRVANEIQLATITTEELVERTKSYLNSGIDVTWWLGGKANTPTNRYWVADIFGDVRILEFARMDLKE